MHKVKYHQKHDNDDSLIIEATDHPGDGGMNHVYRVLTTMPASPFKHHLGTFEFQIGDSFRRGINGLTDEALLAIVIDRLEHVQEGPLACNQFQNALKNVHLALETLKARKHQLAIEGGDL